MSLLFSESLNGRVKPVVLCPPHPGPSASLLSDTCVCLVMALSGSWGWLAISCFPAHPASVYPCQWSGFSSPRQEGQWRSLLDGRLGLVRPLLVSFCLSHLSPPASPLPAGLPRQCMAEGSLSREASLFPGTGVGSAGGVGVSVYLISCPNVEAFSGQCK